MPRPAPLRTCSLQTLMKAGAATLYDVREVFRINIEKRVRDLPEIDGLNKDTVITSWMGKFDQILRHEEILAGSFADSGALGNRPRTPQKLAPHLVAPAAAAAGAGLSGTSAQHLLQSQAESVMTREQLYEQFQLILGVRKYEHQMLFNALQVRFTRDLSPLCRRICPSSLRNYWLTHQIVIDCHRIRSPQRSRLPQQLFACFGSCFASCFGFGFGFWLWVSPFHKSRTFSSPLRAKCTQSQSQSQSQSQIREPAAIDSDCASTLESGSALLFLGVNPALLSRVPCRVPRAECREACRPPAASPADAGALTARRRRFALPRQLQIRDGVRRNSRRIRFASQADSRCAPRRSR